MRKQTAAAAMTFVRLLALALSAAAFAPAQAQIYKCEGADGVVEYSNAPSGAGAQNCKAMQLAPITTIPAPTLPPPKPAAAGKGAAGSPAGGAGTTARPAGSENFPKVDSATQRARDSDRKRILEDELRKEEDKLAELRKEYNNGEPERLGNERNYQKYLDRVQQLKEDIARSEASLLAIRRELGTIRN